MEKEIKNRLADSAKSYLTLGLESFHKIRSVNENFQIALGNLTISIELLLKTIIADKCFPFLFTNLPVELKLKLTYPDIEKINPINKITLKDLESFSYNTLQLDNCISIFYVLYPDKKQEFKPYFRFLSNIRNVVIHGAIPQYQKYELEKIAYFSINLIKFLQTDKLSPFRFFKFTKQDNKFYSDYNAIRINRVEKVIKEAKEKLSKTSTSLFLFGPDGWEVFTTSCPICQSDAILSGYSDLLVEQDIEGETVFLQFYAVSYKCDECGLELLDSEELRLAGIEITYDRPDDEIEIFIEQNREYLASQS